MSARWINTARNRLSRRCKTCDTLYRGGRRYFCTNIPSMMSTERCTTSGFGRTALLVSVIACLCFSVGEGLRLRPFPVSAFTESKATSTRLNAATYETSLYKYGPLDVPTRVQKRGKRQVVDYASSDSQTSRELTSHQILLSSAEEPAGIVSLLFGSHLSGRAPPSKS